MNKFYIMILLFCVSPLNGWAKEIFPKLCEPLPVETSFLDVKSNAKEVLFFHNISEYPIWLASLKSSRWTTQLVPDHWAVLYAPTKIGRFRCVQSQMGHEQQVACGEVLAICAQKVMVPKQDLEKLNQWLANYSTWMEARAYLERTGWKIIQKTALKN